MVGHCCRVIDSRSAALDPQPAGVGHTSGGSERTGQAGRRLQRIELFPGATVRDHLFIAERVRRGDGRLWKDLLGMGRPRSDEMARCDEVLDLLGLARLADAPIERLSLGQGRLVEVGRALMTEPKVLLLDEPSSGLDEAETDAFGALLAQLAAEGRAILMVEHDMDLVMSVCDDIHVLDFGRVIASGRPAQIRANPEVQRAYLGYSQADADADLLDTVRTDTQVMEAVR